MSLFSFLINMNENWISSLLTPKHASAAVNMNFQIMINISEITLNFGGRVGLAHTIKRYRPPRGFRVLSAMYILRAFVCFVASQLQLVFVSAGRTPKLLEHSGACGTRQFQWKPNRQPKVIGGQVPPPGAVPWQIDLRVGEDKHYCGGALISSRLILSAAHCYNDGLVAVAGAHGSPGEQQC